MFETYLTKIFAIDDGAVNRKYLLDRLDWFIQRRLALGIINDLNKLKNRLDTNPDKIFDAMRNTLAEVDSAVGRQTIELFSEDREVDVKSDIVTRFDIDIIDRALGGGFQPPMLCVVQGYTNRGKTWVIAHLAKMAARYGESPLVIMNEMSNRMFKKRLKMCITGMTERELRDNPREAREQSKKSMLKRSEIVLLSDDEKGMHVDELPSVLSEIYDKTGRSLRLVLIDSADDMLPPRDETYHKSIERSTAKYVWLKNWAKDNDLCVITTSQAQRRGETKEWLTSGTIGDDINKVRKATLGISINANDDEVDKEMARILIFKATDGPVGAKCWIASDFGRGQLAIDCGRYNRLEYAEMLKGMKSKKEETQ